MTMKSWGGVGLEVGYCKAAKKVDRDTKGGDGWCGLGSITQVQVLIHVFLLAT